MSRVLAAVLAAILATAPLPVRAQGGPGLLVFAAASLTDAMRTVAQHYQAKTGTPVTLSFAGSMTLARQIVASSGADVYVSADQQSMDYLATRGLIAKATRRNVLANALVLIAPKTSSITLDLTRNADLRAALNGGRLAIADTQSVPAGRYARAALTALGLWQTVSDRLAEGEDVRATLALVARGEAPLGIVYATDAKVEPRVRIVATFPAGSHLPIVYPAALTKDAKPGARAFLDYLGSADARKIFASAGFTPLRPPSP